MNKYWFRKRQGLTSNDHGWGWVPISWEGWTLALVLILSIFVAAFVFLGGSVTTNIDPPLTTLFIYLGVVIALIAISAFIAYKKTRP